MEHTGGNPQTRAVADFVSGLRYDAIPSDVRARIKLLILDSLGCALYGADLPWSRILIDTLSGLDSTPAVGLWGTNKRLSAPHAALAIGHQLAVAIGFARGVDAGGFEAACTRAQ